MAASSGNNIARVLRLFTILFRVASRRDGQRLGRAELAEVCECGIKTVYHDLTQNQTIALNKAVDNQYGRRHVA